MNSHAIELPGAKAPFLSVRHVEAIKWIAASLMLFEHFHTFTLGHLPDVVYQLGRSVLPLFAFSLALSTCTLGPQKSFDVLARMLIFACLAQGAGYIGGKWDGLNVLFTLAAGFAAALVVVNPVPLHVRLGALAASAGVSLFCEFGPYGVLAVGLLVAGFRAGHIVISGVVCGLALALINLVNGTIAAYLAVVIVLFVCAWDIRVPRIKHAFYWVYVLQWPVLAVLRLVV